MEMEYFKSVNFIFLVAGHTKNSADCIFNLVKTEYRKGNLFTMSQLSACRRSKHVPIHEAHPENFHDWESYLNLSYRNFTTKGKGGIIKQNHCFRCNYEENRVGNQLEAHICESEMPQHRSWNITVSRQTFMGDMNSQRVVRVLRVPLQLNRKLCKMQWWENQTNWMQRDENF
jgi:hypothetical protein